MGSGSTAYREALGQYTALQEHLKVVGDIELEQAQRAMEFERERYELVKSGRLPGEVTQVDKMASSLVTTIPGAMAEVVTKESQTKILPVLAIGAYLLLRKK